LKAKIFTDDDGRPVLVPGSGVGSPARALRVRVRPGRLLIILILGLALRARCQEASQDRRRSVCFGCLGFGTRRRPTAAGRRAGGQGWGRGRRGWCGVVWCGAIPSPRDQPAARHLSRSQPHATAANSPRSWPGLGCARVIGDGERRMRQAEDWTRLPCVRASVRAYEYVHRSLCVLRYGDGDAVEGWRRGAQVEEDKEQQRGGGGGGGERGPTNSQDGKEGGRESVLCTETWLVWHLTGESASRKEAGTT